MPPASRTPPVAVAVDRTRARARSLARSLAPSPSSRRRHGRDDVIEVFGAREHNLRVDHLVLPKNALVVLTGPSGSGKSSLAFDTIYAEGQRRYVESLSAYARQFLGRLERPAVEKLRGLTPTIAIEQKTASSNPRSTVGTITEVHDYLRVLYARVGRQHCTSCGRPVAGRSTDEILADLSVLPEGTRALVLAPLVTARKGEFRSLFAELASRGFVRVRVDGALERVDAVPVLDKKRKHTLELVVDRVTLGGAARGERGRIAEAVEVALREGKGEMLVVPEAGEPLSFSEAR
ncbi:MAG: excinuclease ABC subunit UvrA, partial [Polyangiaceae bacterium]|nr:excinuclease ABC subunit UvrA [Polyangiaceae bacterium]